MLSLTRKFHNFSCFPAKNETLSDKKILLLEGAPAFKGASKDKYSNRVSAINKRSVGLLKKLDAWNHIESVRCKPVMQMQVMFWLIFCVTFANQRLFLQVWDALSGEMIHFNQPNFSDQVACIVENDLILESLYDQLKNLLNVQVKNLSRLEACKLPKDGVKKSEVTLKSGEEFTCDLLVSKIIFYSNHFEATTKPSSAHQLSSSTRRLSCRHP